MTIEELLARESIRRTTDKYTMASDDYDEDRYITCFTDDAVLELDPFLGKGYLRLEGRQAIYEFVADFFGAAKSGAETLPENSTRHHITSGEIEFIDSKSANTKNYCLVVDSNGVQHSGTYTGIFRKEGDDWLIAHRKWSAGQHRVH